MQTGFTSIRSYTDKTVICLIINFSRGWGHLITKNGLVVGHLNAPGGGNLNANFLKIQMTGGGGGGRGLTFYSNHFKKQS